MSDKFDEFQRLAKMLDEGDVSIEEYELLKAQLYDLDVPGSDREPVAASGGAPGWYNDPDGLAPHQAYWDGEKWTGQTRPGPSGGPVPPPKRNTALMVGIVIAVIGVLVAIGAFALVAVQFAEDAVSETSNELEGSSTEEAMAYGSEPTLDMLFDRCTDGSNADCDMMFYASPIGSDYEAHAETCGSRTSLIDTASTTCMISMDDFSELENIRSQCAGGFFPACDLLYVISPAGSNDETLGATCAGRNDPDESYFCTGLHGFGSRDPQAQAGRSVA